MPTGLIDNVNKYKLITRQLYILRSKIPAQARIFIARGAAEMFGQPITPLYGPGKGQPAQAMVFATTSEKRKLKASLGEGRFGGMNASALEPVITMG